MYHILINGIILVGQIYNINLAIKMKKEDQKFSKQTGAKCPQKLVLITLITQ